MYFFFQACLCFCRYWWQRLGLELLLRSNPRSHAVVSLAKSRRSLESGRLSNTAAFTEPLNGPTQPHSDEVRARRYHLEIPFIFHMHLSQSYLQDKIILLFMMNIFSADAPIGENYHFSVYCTISHSSMLYNFSK